MHDSHEKSRRAIDFTSQMISICIVFQELHLDSAQQLLVGDGISISDPQTAQVPYAVFIAMDLNPLDQANWITHSSSF